MTEVWRSIPSCPKYEASSLGRIRRVAWRTTGRTRVLRPQDNGNGYLMVAPCHGNQVKVKYVHRLVTEAFHGPCPPGHVSAHLDGIRQHNTPENLRWVTPKENEAHKLLHGTRAAGERCHRSVLSNHEACLLGAHVAFGSSIAQAARVFGINHRIANDIVHGRTYLVAGGYLDERTSCHPSD